MAAGLTEYNLAHTALRRAELNPDREAIEFKGRVFTYREFAERVRKAASVLQANGVCRGDRVGYLGLNHSSFLETVFAANMLGAIFVPFNFRLTAEELAYIINDAGIHTLIVDQALQPVADKAKPSLSCRKFMAVENDADGWDNFNTAIEASEPLQEMVSMSQDDVSLIMYTSGTTGSPKGAMLTHGNLFWSNYNGQLCAAGSINDVVLTAAPLFHIGGLNVVTLNSFLVGSKLILKSDFDPGDILSTIETEKVTHMFGAPAMFQFMMQHPNFAKTNFESIETFLCGAAPPPESLLTTYADRGVPFCQGYGLTETAPFGAFLTTEWSLSKLGSAGQPGIQSSIKIVDDNNQTLPTGERGEVCLKGPNIMKGYWNRPEATAEAIDAQGWFHSGDVGYLDDDGFLFICDRLKDMVITGGENVYPAEVESVLFKHESISEVAVIGLPDDKWGEAVTAVVAFEEGKTLSLEEIRAFAEQYLGRFKLPSRLHVVDALPRNPAGKVLKFKLREELI